MLTRTVKTRRLVAAATLAALPLFAGTLQSVPVHATPDAAGERNVTEPRNGPQWSFVVKEDDDRRVCWLLSGWAEVWCRVFAP